MKKKLLFGFAVVFVAVALIGCGKKEKAKEEGTATEETEEIAVSTEIETIDDLLNNVLAAYTPKEECFAIIGGTGQFKEYGKTTFCDTTNIEEVVSKLHIPAELIGQTDAMAYGADADCEHNITMAAVHLTDAKSMDAFVESLASAIRTTEWSGGYPERFVVYQVKDEYVAYATGIDFCIDSFTKKLEFVYKDAATLLLNETIEIY